jgi:hypothetical protein
MPETVRADAIHVSLTKDQLAELIGAELAARDDERDVIRHVLDTLDEFGLLVREPA